MPHSLLSQHDYKGPSILEFRVCADDQDFPPMDSVSNPDDWEQKKPSAGETTKLLEARLHS